MSNDREETPTSWRDRFWQRFERWLVRQVPKETSRRSPGPSQPGLEWEGLRAENSLSLIPPDPDHTYFVRITDDGTFTVGVDNGSSEEDE